MFRFASLLLALTLAPAAAAQLAGTYTIDGSQPTAGTNYQTFADATAALGAQGVSAAVTFEVAAGTYNEQVTVPVISGVSSSRRVTFQGPAAGALPQIRATAPSAAADWVVGIEGRYVTLARLRMTVGNPFQPLGTVVSIGSSAGFAYVVDSETVSNNGSFATGIAAGVLSRCEVSLIQGVTGSGGTHGIVVSPSAGTVHDKSQHAIWDNAVSGVRDRGILVERQENPGQALAIQRNTVTQTSSGAGFVGIEVADLTGRSVLTENRVQIEDGTGIRLAEIDEGAFGTTIVVNAMVTVGGSGVPVDVVDVGSLVFQSSTLYNAFQSFPTLRLDALSAGAEIRNLILSRPGSGPTLVAPAGAAALDHVVFDTQSRSSDPFRVEWDGTTYTDAITFEAAETAATAIGTFPIEYVSAGAGDLHLTGTSDGDGRLIGVLAGVPEDIDGDTRDAEYPYVGADEAPTTLVPIPPALAGTYTLDPSGPATLPNFTSFSAFASALRNQGVSAPVELQVVSGTYGTSTFSTYPGASALRPVSIVPAANATAPLTITAQTLILTADHVTFDGVTMRNVRVEGASNVTLRNGLAEEVVAFLASDVVIEDNQLEAVEVLSSTDVLVQDNDVASQGVYGVFVRQGTDVVLRDNVVSGAQYGIWVEAIVRPVVEGNDVTVPDDSEAIGAGIYVGRYTPSPTQPSQYSEDPVVRGNHVDLGVRRRTFQFRPYGISVPFILGSARIEGNRVTVASEANGIKAGAHFDTEDVTIVNNIIQSEGASAVVYTRRNDLVPPVLIAHNTLFGGASIFSNGVTISNNIIVSTSGFTPLSMGAFAPAEMDYNVLAGTASVLFRANDTNYPDLAAIQAETPYEANGASFFPEFVDVFGGDFHLFGSSVGDARLAAPRLPGVLTDVDGDARPALTYRGADEVAGSPQPEPTVEGYVVTNPIANDYFAWGEPINIRWTTEPDTPAGDVRVRLLCDGAPPYSYRRRRDNDGAVGFLMPSLVGVHGGPADPDGGCVAEIALADDPSYVGVSPSFVVQDAAKSVAITEPTRFDRYGLQGRFHWRWDPADIPGDSDVRLSLICEGRTREFVRFASTANDGNQGLELLPDFGAWDNCHAQVAAVDDLTVYGRGMSFEILDEPLPAIEVTAPTAGTVWAAGTMQTITWTTVSTDPDVRVYIFLDNLAAGAPNRRARLAIVDNDDGAFTWAIPPGQLPSAEYRIRLAAYAQDGSLIRDIQFPFTITAPSTAKAPPASIPLERGWARVVAPTATDAAAWLAPLAADGRRVVARDDAGRLLSLTADGSVGDLRALAAGTALEVWVDGDAALGAAPVVSAPTMRTPHFALAGDVLARPAALWTVTAPGLADGDEVAVLDADGVVAGRGVVAGGTAAVTLGGPEVSTLSVEPEAWGPLTLRAWRHATGDELALTLETITASGTAIDALAFVAGADWQIETAPVASVGSEARPDALTLRPVAPNPTRGRTVVRVGTPSDGAVTATVFDVRGRVVAVLASGQDHNAGWLDLEIDARSLAAGVYVVRVQTAAEIVTERFTVIR